MSSGVFGASEGGGRVRISFWKWLKSYVNLWPRGTAELKNTVLNMQNKVFFYDDFLGDVLADQWNLVTGGSGTATVISAVNGVCQLDDTTSEDDAGIDFGSFFNFDPTLHAVIEVKAAVDTLTNLLLNIGLYKDTDEYVLFEVDDTDNNIDCKASKSGGSGAVDVDSGVDLDTDYHIYRIECYDDGSAKFFIDNSLVYTAPAGTLSATAGVLHKPYIYIKDKSGQTTQHKLDIDYVFIHQDRT